MVRPGAILYGYHPGFDPPERREEFETKLPLRPVMSLRGRLMSVRSIAAGEAVGYDATWIAQRPSRIAVLSAGYADGVTARSAIAGSLHPGSLRPMIGIVSMDVSCSTSRCSRRCGGDGLYTLEFSVTSRPTNMAKRNFKGDKKRGSAG